jgi:acetyl esterase/lipase
MEDSMTITTRARTLIGALAFWLGGAAQASEVSDWLIEAANRYRVVPDITYLIADGHESKLDVIGPRDTSRPLPTLIYIHGGGWVGGDKDAMLFALLPYLEMGFAVVNVEYRLARVALAPGAVEDCRCALRWVLNHSEAYGFDPARIVVTGHSAGGHLTLTTGMLPAGAGLDRRCPAPNPDGGRADARDMEMPVAALINWFGITDVADLVEGPNAKTYALAWMGGMADWRAVAARVSPLEYVRPGLPPILTIHGNADDIVPYEHAVRLQKALERAEVPARLHTVDGGGHGGFSVDESRAALRAIRSFLIEHDLLAPTGEG